MTVDFKDFSYLSWEVKPEHKKYVDKEELLEAMEDLLEKDLCDKVVRKAYSRTANFLEGKSLGW